MSDAPRTHRDTLAFLLTMAGASSWALFPVAAMLRDHDVGDPRLRLAVSLVVGALLGAWAAATVWRAVSLITVGVAGALCAALAIGSIRAIKLGALPSFDVADLAIAAAVAGAAIAGAALGRRSKRSRQPLVCALIAVSADGIWGLTVGILAAFGYATLEVSLLVMLAAPAPAIVLAMYLCRDATPRAVGGWVFALIVSMMAIAVIGTDHRESSLELMLGAVILGMMAYGATAIVGSLARRFLPRPNTPPPVPIARVH